MSNFFQSVRSGFGRQSNKTNGSGNQRTNGSNNSSPTTPNPTVPPLGSSSSVASNLSSEGNQQLTEAQIEPEAPKFFFMEKYARLGVRGNFMPLAAQPANLDLGEWLAHHCMENYRLIENLVQCIQEIDGKTGLAICNPRCCPTMSAGSSHTYTWLDSHRNPVKVPAAQYISLVQRWIVGKLSDPRVFPVDPVTSSPAIFASSGTNTPDSTSPIPMGPTTLTTPVSTLSGRDWVGKNAGFPESFFNDTKTIFRQLFRVYAHLYHAHWIDPFWHMSTEGASAYGWTDLNSSFAHFITFAKLFGMLSDKDIEPMQPLIDIWIANGTIPADAAAGACTIVPAQ